MPTRKWDFRDDNLQRYAVELDHGYWSGLRVVRVNGREVLRAKKRLDTRSELRFAVDGHECRLSIRSTGLKWAYDLVVDGQPVAIQGTTVRRVDGAAAERPSATDGVDSLATLALQQHRDNGARWFYWIAGLSLLNLALYAVGSDLGFAVGTVIGFLLQGVIAFFAGETVAWFAHAPIIGLFFWLGRQALRGHGWAFATGGAIFALDAVLLLVLVQDWFGIAVHGFGLFGILQGWRAQRLLQRLPVASALPASG